MPSLPWGFTNSTSIEDGVVCKRYDGPDAADRRGAEYAFLTGCFGAIPVPRVLSTADESTLRTELMPGIPGTDAIENGHADWVFREAGRLLRQLARLAERGPLAALPGKGPVLVHGDFGPQNLLVDVEHELITALVDGEWARRASVELRHGDAAWFEWIIRFHHPQLVSSLGAFFEAYGECPPWAERKALMLRRGAEILEFSTRRDGVHGTGPRRWRERVAATQRFTEA